jgi:hypothetical protein
VQVRNQRSFGGCPGRRQRSTPVQHAAGTRLFLGCKRYGPTNQNKKRTLVLDSDPYRYRQFISDISGQDIRCHNADPQRAIREVRDWLQTTSKRTGLAGGGEIIEHYRRFQSDLPTICAELALEADKLTFLDLSTAIADWLQENR